MAVNTNQTYQLTGEDVQAFNRTYGTYEEFRNALIKTSENQPLFLRELNGQIQNSDLEPHFDGVNSLAIGYGLDLLVRGNQEINQYLAAAGLGALSVADEQVLNSARVMRNYYNSPLHSQAQKNQYLDNLAVTINGGGGQVISFPSGASAAIKYQVLIDHYSTQLELALGDIQDANEILSRHLDNTLENRVSQTNIPDSKERAAILSVLYQIPGSPTLIGLANGTVQGSGELTRAKIWLEIRYYTNNDPAFRDRRNRESDAFGLFEGPNGTFLGDTNEALSTADYFFRGDRVSSSGLVANIYDFISGLPSGLQQDFKVSISPALTHLSGIYTDGLPLDAAYGLRDDEVDLDVSGISSSGVNLIRGNQEGNTVHGGGRQDFIYGLGGDDTLYGEGGEDKVYGEAGNDVIYVSAPQTPSSNDAGMPRSWSPVLQWSPIHDASRSEGKSRIPLPQAGRFP